MSDYEQTLMHPPIEELRENTGSKFLLTMLAAKRCKEITNYMGELGSAISTVAPPQIVSKSSKPLSMAMEEIAAGKIVAVEVDDEASHDPTEQD